jgi:hypothetical protein
MKLESQGHTQAMFDSRCTAILLSAWTLLAMPARGIELGGPDPYVGPQSRAVADVYQRAIPQDLSQLRVSREILLIAGEQSAVQTLDRFIERSVLGDILGQPRPAGATLAEALKNETGRTDAFDAMRRQILDTTLTVHTVDSTGTEALWRNGTRWLPDTKGVYEGDSIWVARTRDGAAKTLYVRLMVKNVSQGNVVAYAPVLSVQLGATATHLRVPMVKNLSDGKVSVVAPVQTEAPAALLRMPCDRWGDILYPDGSEQLVCSIESSAISLPDLKAALLGAPATLVLEVNDIGFLATAEKTTQALDRSRFTVKPDSIAWNNEWGGQLSAHAGAVDALRKMSCRDKDSCFHFAEIAGDIVRKGGIMLVVGLVGAVLGVVVGVLIELLAAPSRHRLLRRYIFGAALLVMILTGIVAVLTGGAYMLAAVAGVFLGGTAWMGFAVALWLTIVLWDGGFKDEVQHCLERRVA